MFHREENSSHPITVWGWSFLTDYQVVDDVVGLPHYNWFPDGHISTVQDKDTGDWVTFYPNHESFRSRSSVSGLPEDAQVLEPRSKVTGGLIQGDVYNNGGEWLYAVFLTGNGSELTGFIHNEDHFWTDNGILGYYASPQRAYKSISLACSSDFGKSWNVRGQIMTIGEKPSPPKFSGFGDFDVVWDWQYKRWFLIGSKLRGAVSYNKSGAAESWRKWDGANFTRNNFLDESERFKDTNNEFMPRGEHPSLHWNRFLQQWLLVYNGYDGNIYITSALKLPRFQPPRILIQKKTEDQRNWYPTVLSRQFGDKLGDETLNLYWADFENGPSVPNRIFRKVVIQLHDKNCTP